MSRLAQAGVTAAAFGIFQFGIVHAASQAVLGRARFTVITPYLIRLEYAPDGRFENAPSWFAADRASRFEGARIVSTGGRITIDTGALYLEYTDQQRVFSPGNLSIRIRAAEKDAADIVWKPGMPQNENLGGTASTLDRKKGAFRLPDGLISRNGWYVLDDSHSVLADAGWYRERSNAGARDWYFFGYGRNFQAALRSMTAISGQVPMPRRYAMGAWYSRFWPYSSEEFKEIVSEFHRHDFPLDVMVMDMDWHVIELPGSGPGAKPRILWTGYTWNRDLIPDPKGLLDWMHQQGLAVTLNDHPAQGVMPNEAVYSQFSRRMGVDPAGRTVLGFDAGSRHYLETFYDCTHRPLDDIGCDFWWLDWQQFPGTRSLPSLTNLASLNRFYFDESRSHGRRGMSFSRWAGWGDHRYPIHFSGDADTGWEMLAFEIPFTSTAANAGCFFWSHDIGGHMGGRNEESYTRWCQFGALSAALRVHSTRDAEMDRRPWTYPPWAEESMRRSFHLRSELMPYLYTAAWRAHADSVPYIRPMYWAYPHDEEAYRQGQEYLLGDNLLVAPITSPGVGPGRVASQGVWFPGGEWRNFFTGERYTKRGTVLVTADINELPLFVRAGAPIPMQAYVERPGHLLSPEQRVLCFAGPDGERGDGLLYEDDSISADYLHGARATTRLRYERHGPDHEILIGAREGAFSGASATRHFVVELAAIQRPTSALVNNRPAVFRYDAANHRAAVDTGTLGSDRSTAVLIRADAEEPVLLRQQAMDRRMRALGSGDPAAPETRTMIEAVHGKGVFDEHLHPYFLGGNTAPIRCDAR